MKLNRSVFAGAAAVAALAALASAPARASDVTWSVGVHAAPGVTIGATNARPYYVHPQPVYVRPSPCMCSPGAAFTTRPGYYVRPAAGVPHWLLLRPRRAGTATGSTGHHRGHGITGTAPTPP
jgi:hypothetical protein